MAKTLNTLLAEADEIISGKAEIKTASTVKDDISALAEEIKVPASVEEYSLIEKVAYARAIMDTVLNLDHLRKVAEFEERAQKAGIPGEKVAEYFEKNGAAKFKSVTDLMD